MVIVIREMRAEDFNDVVALWEASEGVSLSGADTRPNFARYLERNAGTSYVAAFDDKLVGAILCGHDGRSGLIHYLAVEKSHRRSGIGHSLVRRALQALARQGIQTCHLLLSHAGREAVAFWERIGWSLHHEVAIMSCPTQE